MPRNDVTPLRSPQHSGYFSVSQDTDEAHSSREFDDTTATDYRNMVVNALRALTAEDRTGIRTFLWRKSLFRSNMMMLLYFVQAFAFISNNVAVNWFSFDKNWRGKLDRNLIFTLNLLFALGTIISNLFSKVVEVVDTMDGLELDANHSGLANFLVDGPQRSFIKNILDRLLELTYPAENYHYVVALTIEEICSFHPTPLTQSNIKNLQNEIRETLDVEQIDRILGLPLANSLRYLKSEFAKISKNGVSFVLAHSDVDFINMLADEHTINKHYVLISTQAEDELNLNRSYCYELITVYPYGWSQRLTSSLRRLECREFCSTLLKASLASQRWLLSKGMPGLVVLATGIVSFSYIFAADKMTNPAAQASLFFANAALTWIGKVHINNRLKGDSTDVELRRIAERTMHHQPLFYRTNPCASWAIVLITLTSIIPLNITSAWFYTADGIDTALVQFNRFTGLDLFLPMNVATFITYFAVAASLPMALATNSKPFYTTLASTRYCNTVNSEEKLDETSQVQTKSEQLQRKGSNQSHKILWRVFLVATLLDGLKCGDNAVRNVAGTLDILARGNESVADFNQSQWPLFIIVPVAASNAASNICFSIERAKDKFDSAMNAIAAVHENCKNFSLFRSSQINSVNANTQADLRTPMLTGHALEHVTSIDYGEQSNTMTFLD